MALIAAEMIRAIRLPGRGTAWMQAGLVGLVLFYQLWGNLDSALHYPPGLTTQFDESTVIDHAYDQALIDFLTAEGETAGYANYWVTYPIAFKSQETLIFVPRLPYHQDLRYTPRDDRYAPYTKMVANSPRVAYITTRNTALDQYLQDNFTRLGVTWQERQIGDYHVYYHLSRAVRPVDVGLGGMRE